MLSRPPKVHNPCAPLIILCSVFCFQYPQRQTDFSCNAMNNTRIVLVSVHQYIETIIADIGGNIRTGM